jgi:hypothetical protein
MSGGWKHGNRHGTGRLSCINKDYKEGTWENGIFTGQSRLTCDDSSVFEGRLIKINTGNQKKGRIQKDTRHGPGKRVWRNGEFQEGIWESGLFVTGKCNLTYPDGSKYKGEIVQGKRDGAGRLDYKNGDWQEGQWNSGELLHGECRLTLDEGTYTGTLLPQVITHRSLQALGEWELVVELEQ